jgi:poly(hydroxyalkanoate) depolymerase family esterase
MPMLRQDILREATRLTRAGQLVEATALLARMLRGDNAPAAAPPATDRIAIAGREPLIIDATPLEVTDGPDLPPAASAARPQGHRNSFDPFGQRAGIEGLGLEGRGAALRRPPPSTPDLVPAGARFIEGTYANAAGNRAYRLFIPSGYRGEPLPLVIMLHGCTQSPEDFAAGTQMNLVAEEHSCLVAYPAQSSQANQARCWNWFRPADQARGRGEPSLIAGITRQIMRDHAVDPKRVYVGGLSAGAAAAATLGVTYGDLYAAIGVHSGLACGAAVDLPSALIAMRQGGASEHAGPLDRPPVPAIVFHGDRDTTVHPNNGDQMLERSIRTAGARQQVQRGQVPGGHAYTRTTLRDARGRAILEHWNIHGAGHAWSGGSPAGSYTDPRGPDATREMLRFFLEHSQE